MKLIIDIPDNDYKHIKEYYEKNDTVEATYSYIYHGTPLPKGHGRLIDADAMKKHYPIMENDFGMVVNEHLHKELDNEPTILEADKAGSEG